MTRNPTRDIEDLNSCDHEPEIAITDDAGEIVEWRCACGVALKSDRGDGPEVPQSDLLDAAAWLDEEWQRLAPRLPHTTGRDHQDVATRMAVYAELCGSFRGWAATGREPQHGPDWRVTDGRRVAEHRRAIEQFRKDAPNAFDDVDEVHEILEDT